MSIRVKACPGDYYIYMNLSNPTYQSPGLCTAGTSLTIFSVTSVMIFMAISRVNVIFNKHLNGLFNENEHSLVCSPLLIHEFTLTYNKPSKGYAYLACWERAPSSVITPEPRVLPLSGERGLNSAFSPDPERSPRVLLPVLGKERG